MVVPNVVARGWRWVCVVRDRHDFGVLLTSCAQLLLCVDGLQ